jgi:hypothetical protein
MIQSKPRRRKRRRTEADRQADRRYRAKHPKPCRKFEPWRGKVCPACHVPMLLGPHWIRRAA